MKFSIIYSVDCPCSVSITQFNPPPKQKRLWRMTEGDEQFEYNDCWPKGKHRKWCGILDKDKFQEFLDHTGLFPEDIRTMGSLGAPGCGFGLVPAFSFRNDDPESIQNAYVTPLATRSEIVAWIQKTNEDHGTQIPIPAILTDDEQQQHLPGMVDTNHEAEIAEDSIRECFLANY